MTAFVANFYCNHDLTLGVFTYQLLDEESHEPLGEIKLQCIPWKNKRTFSQAHLSELIDWSELEGATVYAHKHSHYAGVPESVILEGICQHGNCVEKHQELARKHVAAMKFRREA